MVAMKAGQYHIALDFIDKGVDINTSNAVGQTPLYLAVKNNLVRIAEKLLKKGAKSNTKTSEGLTPLHEAVKNNHLEMINELIRYGADVNIADNLKDTPLLMACKKSSDNKNSNNIIMTLVNKGAYLDIENNKGLSPIVILDNRDGKERVIKSVTVEDVKAIFNVTDFDGTAKVDKDFIKDTMFSRYKL